MSKVIIYGAGLLVVCFIVSLLGFLTFDNLLNNRAIYGTRSGEFNVSGFPSILVNLGILGFISSLLLYIAYLFKRNKWVYQCYTVSGFVSCFLVFGGLFWPWV